MKNIKFGLYFSLSAVFSLIIAVLVLIYIPVFSFSGTSFAEEKAELEVYIQSGGNFSLNGYDVNDNVKMFPDIKVKIWRIDENSGNGIIKKKPIDSVSENELDRLYGNSYENKTGTDGVAYFKDIPSGKYYIRSEDVFSTSIVDVKNNVKNSAHLKGSDRGDTPVDEKKGKKRFLKLDMNTEKALSGAKFTVSKLVDGNYEPVKINGKTAIYESDSNGRFEVENMDYGKYYLTETVSPKNSSKIYSLLASPVEFTIDENSYDSGTIAIYNKSSFKSQKSDKPETGEHDKEKTDYRSSNRISIPKTGDIQIYLYSISGVLIFISGMCISGRITEEE